MTDEEAEYILTKQERELLASLNVTPERIAKWKAAQEARLAELTARWEYHEARRRLEHPCGCYYGCPACQPDRKWYK